MFNVFRGKPRHRKGVNNEAAHFEAGSLSHIRSGL